MTSTRRRALGASAPFVACLHVSLTAGAAPRPVFAPGGGGFADPTVVSNNSQLYSMSTGSLVSEAFVRHGRWHVGSGPGADQRERLRAPLRRPVVGLDENQRCIGAATASSPLGPFTPVAGGPLVCPGRASTPAPDDNVPERPIATAGVIDPSGFKDSDGTRFLLYKTDAAVAIVAAHRPAQRGGHAGCQRGHQSPVVALGPHRGEPGAGDARWRLHPVRLSRAVHQVHLRDHQGADPGPGHQCLQLRRAAPLPTDGNNGGGAARVARTSPRRSMAGGASSSTAGFAEAAPAR